MKLSIIVCTFNRVESLRNTMDSLLRLESTEGFDYEIIIVDNNSWDQTKATVEKYAQKSQGRLKYILFFQLI